MPVLIEAHRSALTYGQQMRAATDARLELDRLRHEVDVFEAGPVNSAFAEWPEMRKLINRMQIYLLALEREFRGEYKRLSELRRKGEEKRTLQVQFWERISALPMIADMLCLECEPVEDTRYSQELLWPYGDLPILMKTQIARTQDILKAA